MTALACQTATSVFIIVLPFRSILTWQPAGRIFVGPHRAPGRRNRVRDAFESRRCIIPASGFYEWQKTDATKTPYAIVPSDEPLFAFAGLWENWRDKAAENGAEWIRTCAIITGPPNALVTAIHDRMPVILPQEAWARWLGEHAADRDELQSLLKPYPAERMKAYTISARVTSVKNDDEGLIEPTMVSITAG
jgi:putative SOS response-associated peptidase YedK